MFIQNVLLDFVTPKLKGKARVYNELQYVYKWNKILLTMFEIATKEWKLSRGSTTTEYLSLATCKTQQFISEYEATVGAKVAWNISKYI